MGLPLPHLGNYPLAPPFHTVVEWLFGIKGAIESVPEISLRFLASLTNVLLLPAQRGIYLSVRNTLCFHFVWNSLLPLKMHLWNKMKASSRYFPRGSTSLHPAHVSPGLWAVPSANEMQSWSTCFKNRTPWIAFISKVPTAALIHTLLERFLSWMFSLVFPEISTLHLKGGSVVALWLPYLIKIPGRGCSLVSEMCSELAAHHPLGDSSSFQAIISHASWKSWKCVVKSQLQYEW